MSDESTPPADHSRRNNMKRLWKVNYSRIAKVLNPQNINTSVFYTLPQVADLAGIPKTEQYLRKLQDDLQVLITLGYVELKFVGTLLTYRYTGKRMEKQ